MRALPAIAIAAVAAATACGDNQRTYVPNIGDGRSTPTMATTDVVTMISDSGYTRYRVATPLWQMFEDCDSPYWRFPHGLELDQYDLSMQPESHIECDSAVYFSQRRLWRLDGRVMMVNSWRDSFLTEQLFWDQLQRRMYSDSFIHIVRTDRIIEGYGFESNQNMTRYTVRRPTAILPVEQQLGKKHATSDSAAAPSAVADSTTPTERRQPQRRQRRTAPGFTPDGRIDEPAIAQP